MNRQKIYGLIISSALLIGAIGLPTTVTYAQTLPNHNINSTITTNSNSIKTENLTINFGNMFNWNAYLTNVNINVIVNGKTYTENYDYSGSLTINNVLGNNTIKIEIPYYNTITLNTNSNNITVNPVETPMTFDGNKALANAVANAIQASPNELTYYNLASYCYGVENNYGVAPLDINLSGQHLTTLNGIQQLKGFDINSLNLSYNNLTDISALDGLTINNLDLSHNNITNIDSLANVSNLQSLNISANNVTSTKILSNINGLKITK
ncbi:Leucine Rich repeats (2 copies) [Sarcina ventriculi]|uniref:leucine-rich repeat domain-containing protein n=1 Tax=Sarcina ventriculi TaxID=1267 RepID=UPI000D8C3CD3|nr:leucine-rich repeat domain-containing protein [Sarcina ventriculi]SPZ49990.1 Leucine Rich repeats (2 copies) [Sarcina ventriculi]